MGWYKHDVDSDKIVFIAADKELPTSLTGSKDVISLLGDTDKQVTLLGDKTTSLLGDSDKIVSLLGSVGVSLEGAKHIAFLLGELETSIQLLGDAPYSYFKIRIDNTFITVDYTDIKADRD